MATAKTHRPRSEKTFGWRAIAAGVIPLILLVGKYRVIHPERIPREGAFVLSPNHNTNFDPLVSAYAVWRSGRVPRFLAKAGLFRVPVIGGLLRFTGQIPVERTGAAGPGAGDRPSKSIPQKSGDAHAASPLSAASRLVDDGLALIVYPEGTLTREPDLWPMRGKSGAVRLAIEHNIPLIPCAHWGAQRILPRYSKRISLFPRKRVDIIIGEPVDLSAFRDRPRTSATYAEATEVVMTAITALLEELRGESAPPGRWDPTKHGQTEIGRF